MKQIENLITNKYDHHLFPYFWQKGQDDQTTVNYIQQMYEQGIRNFTVESRPDPEFLKEGWWHRLDLITKEAKKRGMHYWILDDKHFPTGAANDQVPEEFRKHFLEYRRADFVSTGVPCIFDLSTLADIKKVMKDKKHLKDRLVRLILVKNDVSDNRSFVEGSEEDLTDKISTNRNNKRQLYLKLPRGDYSLLILYDTMADGEKFTENYLDPMRKEATQILIDQVYEPHWHHLGSEFGKTIKAFFSDEPRFGSSSYRTDIVGKTDSPLPWNEEVEKKLLNINTISSKDLIYLFIGTSEHAKQVRFHYLDIISQLYSENFSQVIGNWCQEHGVDYVGHVIEDDNAHARIGQGAGHYFRAMAGQTIAGIDDIGGQIIPGMPYLHTSMSRGGSDGEFYHYALCTLGASDAKLDPKKEGRLMCESFGAYGWSEGLREMKWITDQMISHGVNWLVPHAFNPAKFPDFDCPPHFYAHGNNPEFPYFHIWANYADRLCYLFSNGYHVVHVGVLYHAFAEWTAGETMYFQRILKVLEENQIAGDVISEDYLKKAQIKNNSIEINNYCYQVLLIPATSHLPLGLANLLRKIGKKVQILFINQVPSECQDFAEKVDLKNLPFILASYRSVVTDKTVPDLTTYEYQLNDGKAWMFFNESVNTSVSTNVVLNSNKELAIYDAMDNQLYKFNPRVQRDQSSFLLNLRPYESVVIVENQAKQENITIGSLVKTLNSDFRISEKSYNSKSFTLTSLTRLGDFAHYDSSFSGTLKYEKEIEVKETNIVLEIPEAFEIVNIKVNGKDCGTRICPNYIFDLSKALKRGKNKLEIIVVDTLVHKIRDPFSMNLPMDPIGILSPIKLFNKK